MGAGARPPSINARPKSAYGQVNGHARSKSHHQGVRPATATMQRDEEDDDSEQERKGVQPFPISTKLAETLKVPKKVPPVPERRTNSLNVSRQRILYMFTPRSISSPSIPPVVEAPVSTDCDQACANLEALTLRNSKAGNRGSRVGRGMTSGKETNSFVKPKKTYSQLPQPTPTPTRQQQPLHGQTPLRPPSTTPRKQAPFLNRYTNDRCPDFYDDRIEAMERDFREFKQQMEGDVRQATSYKESIQQLQNRGMSAECTTHPYLSQSSLEAVFAFD